MMPQRKALHVFGLKHQLRKLAEECSELAAAAIRLAERETGDLVDHLCEEVADVEIVIDGMRQHFGDALIDRYRASKLQRLASRLRVAEKESELIESLPPTAAPDIAETQAKTPEKAAVSHKKAVKPANPLSPIPDGYLTINEAATVVGKTPAAITQAVKMGKIGRKKVGGRVFVSLADVKAYYQRPRNRKVCV